MHAVRQTAAAREKLVSHDGHLPATEQYKRE